VKVLELFEQWDGEENVLGTSASSEDGYLSEAAYLPAGNDCSLEATC
jgi:hypothetical protein